ncbi:hypothetical protein SCLCIDRAFT_1223244 [Scleroderma citrinum Foug A]|uniref:Uncharacterized protein n=1 Tax=Scleroderma citrinum Foug A TaxID=1036808 RepID=A0A0C2ZJV5_9AGAM|nr:hypothetical protein SCLCIDRAFT_1223244 [Scleroderma citrinum Foug A]
MAHLGQGVCRRRRPSSCNEGSEITSPYRSKAPLTYNTNQRKLPLNHPRKAW